MSHHRNLSARHPRTGSYPGERDDTAPPFRFYGYEEDLVEDRDRLALQPYNGSSHGGGSSSPSGLQPQRRHRSPSSSASWTQDASGYGPSAAPHSSAGGGASADSARPRNYYENVSVGDHSHHIILAPKGDTITVRNNKIGSHSTEWMGQITENVAIQLSKDQARIAREEAIKAQAAAGASSGMGYKHGYGHGDESP